MNVEGTMEDEDTEDGVTARGTFTGIFTSPAVMLTISVPLEKFTS